jgi:hypothetical protein
MHRLVGHLHERRARIGIGIDGDGLDTHAAGGLDDPAGDFATIGDEDFLEQCSHGPRSKAAPCSSAW